MSRYTVRKEKGTDFLPWGVHRPDGRRVWSSNTHRMALTMAFRFAMRNALHEDLKEKGI